MVLSALSLQGKARRQQTTGIKALLVAFQPIARATDAAGRDCQKDALPKHVQHSGNGSADTRTNGRALTCIAEGWFPEATPKPS